MSLIDIGPETFTDSEELVISHKGSNYYKACDAVVKIDDLGNEDSGRSHCLKRVGHPGNVHEDWAGNTREDG